jgi:hypothetical protein
MPSYKLNKNQRAALDLAVLAAIVGGHQTVDKIAEAVFDRLTKASERDLRTIVRHGDWLSHFLPTSLQRLRLAKTICWSNKRWTRSRDIL